VLVQVVGEIKEGTITNIEVIETENIKYKEDDERNSKSRKIYEVSDKNNNNQDFVIDYDDNTVYNKEGFYFLKHAEPIKKVASDDLKGKSSVGKSSGTYSEIGSSADVVDIEIDMGDER